MASTLLACAQPPGFTPNQGPVLIAQSVVVPASWSVPEPSVLAQGTHAAGQAPSWPWWQRFDDPLLSALTHQALAANTSIRSAQATLAQARALRAVASAGLWPTLGASAQASKSSVGEQETNDRFQVSLAGNWLPDLSGGQRSALEVRLATVEALSATLGDVQVGIAAEVALNYISLRAAQTRLNLASDNLLSQIETWQLTQWREQAGLLSRLESEQALTAVAQTRALLPALQTGIEQSQHALAVLTAQAPAALTTALNTPSGSAKHIPQLGQAMLISIPADTLRQRPDVRAAERQVAASLARVSVADAARMPSFVLSGSLGLSALTLGTLTHGASALSTVLAGVSWPVFDGGAARAQLQAEQAALEQSRVAYQAVVLGALKDVEDSLVALRGDRQRQQALAQAAAAATQAATLARQRHEGGLIDFQTVLITQRTQLTAQDSLASAHASVGASQVRLFKALGGGWRDDSTRASVP
jgi:outer membrane protein, multidrug efflux system